MLQAIGKIIGLGALAGMRSLAAPAMVSRHLRSQPSVALEQSPLAFMQAPKAATWLTVLAAAEMIGDKAPGAPDRIALPALLSRGIAGALVGAALGQVSDARPAAGALVGGVAALAATYGSFYLRQSLGKHTEIADPVWGLLEDAWVVGNGVALLGTTPPAQP